jgi:arylsulfatase A-like enzyme
MRAEQVRVSLLLLALVQSLAPVGRAATEAPAPSLEESLRGLASESASVRFDSALVLADSLADEPGLATRLAASSEAEPFNASPEAAAALEFVRWKLSGQSLPPLSGSARTGTNVVVISVDTLRPDHLGCYGYDRPVSPNIDALARSGAVFDAAISPAPWTLPAHMSLLTSLYPSFHKLDKGGKRGSSRLDESETTLAEILRSAGYATTAFVAHPFLDHAWGFDRGFDLYRRYVATAGPQADRASFWLEWHRFHVERGLASPDFFLFLHVIDPHETYSAPPPYQLKFVSDYRGDLKPADHLVTMFLREDFDSPADFQYALDLYDGEINYVDASLGRFLRTLDNLGWSDSSLVILTSDHGEEFKDHASMGHKATLYDEQLRVPFILAYPRVIEPGQRVSGQASLVDILPTVLDFVGLESPRMAQGISLARFLKKEGSSKEVPSPTGRAVYAELGPLGHSWERPFRIRAVRTDEYKLILRFDRGGRVTKELYDLATDPKETRNLYASKTADEELVRLEKRLGAFIREGSRYNPESRQKNTILLKDEVLERLRALGYVD